MKRRGGWPTCRTLGSLPSDTDSQCVARSRPALNITGHNPEVGLDGV